MYSFLDGLIETEFDIFYSDVVYLYMHIVIICRFPRVQLIRFGEMKCGVGDYACKPCLQMKLLFYFDFLFDLVKGTCVGRELLHHIFFGLDVKINIFLLKRTRQGENVFNIKVLYGYK